MDFLELAEKRFSCRAFEEKKVEREVVDKILRAGQVAPTAVNNQPQRIFVIESEEALEKLRKCTKSHYHAPLAMLVCCDMEECWKRPFDGKPSGDIDASIVCTHLMLEAAELGVGSTWVMFFDPAAIRTEFALPDKLEATALLVMGYPKEGTLPGPKHAEVKAIEETVQFL